MGPEASDRLGMLQRPTPTVETQELYNKMRREEERLTFESLCQMQTGYSTPSTSASVATPPSPSYTSTTQSVSRGMNYLAVAEPSEAKKSRSGRHGPLPEATKLRAALLRKLKACDDCRARKVKCSHFDFSLFEDAYQATKQPMSPPVDSDLHVAGSASFQPRLGDPCVDLLGVGDGQMAPGPPSPLFLTASGTDETQPDPDPLRNQQPRLQPHLEPVFSAFEGSQPRFSGPDLAPQLESTLLTHPQPSRFITVGRQINLVTNVWECLRGHPDPASLRGHRDSAFLLPQTRALPAFCGRQFTGVEALRLHFQEAHGPIYQGWSVWQCEKCGLELIRLPPPGRPCPQCSQRDPLGWQIWHYAGR